MDLQNDGWDIIYLRRKNKVNQAMSNIIRNKRGQAQKEDDKKENFNLKLEIDRFESRVKEREEFDRKEEKYLRGLNFFEVIYEEDLMDADKHQQTVDSILTHLNLPKKKAKTRYRKINKSPLKEIIINYDEFQACIEKNKWEAYL
jgi:LPS sulfotransferase NodH